jgi:hypothetical protein
MSEKSDRTELSTTKVVGVQDLMKYEEDTSLAALQEYVIVPFVKLIQGMTDQKLKDEFGEGSAVLRPGDVKIGGREESFLFVPLFFYTEFRKWADRDDKNQMIIESTYDPTSELAKIARDYERWSEVYEEDINKDEKNQRHYRYVEHLCFIGLVFSGDMKGERCMISFQKGDFRVGRGFASGAQMRKVDIGTKDEPNLQQVPLWAQVWEMKVSCREKGTNKWWGFDPSNPATASPIIDAELYEAHAAAYAELKKAHAANRLRVEGIDDGSETSAVDENSEF